MRDRLASTLSRLDAAVGVSGDERAVADVVAAELEGAYDEHSSDVLGNQFFVRRGEEDAPIVMLCAHMDELGFVVQYVDDDGFVRIAPVGYHDPRMVVNQRLIVHGANGAVEGVTGAKPAHVLTEEERQKVIGIDELALDIGAHDRAEAEHMGIRIGDYATFAVTGAFLNGTAVFTGKAVDDRAGCAVMIEAMRRLRDSSAKATVCATAAVQEELGVRGAGPAAFHVRPDVALAIDVTLCGDTPQVEFSRLPIRLGAGPAIKYFDWAVTLTLGNAVPRRLTDRLESAAAAAGVPYQREVLLGGATDAWGISLAGAGTLAGCVSLPSRYIHSAVGCVHLGDLDQAADLIVAFVAGLDELPL
jgi:endoglucanase